MTLIEHIEVGSGGTTEIEFTDIPQIYTDLHLLLSLRSTESGVTTATLDLNLATPTARWLRGNGSTASSNTTNELLFNGSTTTANTFSNVSVYIPNYTSTTQKSGSVDLIVENNTASTSVYQYIYALYWNVNAVTSLRLTDDYGSFVQYSSASLFGILAGSDGTTTVS
jgi:hypothetical protein